MPTRLVNLVRPQRRGRRWVSHLGSSCCPWRSIRPWRRWRVIGNRAPLRGHHVLRHELTEAEEDAGDELVVKGSVQAKRCLDVEPQPAPLPLWNEGGASVLTATATARSWLFSARQAGGVMGFVPARQGDSRALNGGGFPDKS